MTCNVCYYFNGNRCILMNGLVKPDGWCPVHSERYPLYADSCKEDDVICDDPYPDESYTDWIDRQKSYTLTEKSKRKEKPAELVKQVELTDLDILDIIGETGLEI